MRRFQPNYSLRLTYVPRRKYINQSMFNAKQNSSKILNKHGDNLEKNTDAVAKKSSSVLQDSVILPKIVNTETEIIDKSKKPVKESKMSEGVVSQLMKGLLDFSVTSKTS